MELSAAEVEKVARLARLKLSQADIERYAQQLRQILTYAEQLQAVSTEGVEPLVHPHPLRNVFRDDTLQESLPRSEALQNAPKSDGRYFLVPPVLDYA